MASSPHLKAQDLTHYVTVKPARDDRVLQTTPRTDHFDAFISPSHTLTYAFQFPRPAQEV